MKSTLHLFLFLHLLFVLSCFHFITHTYSLSPIQPQCHADERSALLQFKQSFAMAESSSANPSSYSKLSSWKLERPNSSNCCTSWDGVECDESTGHVIGLDLSSSFLFGSINSSSSLFTLRHLQRLNLADNNFNYSQIPTKIGHLSRLTSLNLSQARFSGQIPWQIWKLSKLASLDLSKNVDSSFLGLLKLNKPGFSSLLQNLTNLEDLRLSQVDISSQLPKILANLTSLTTLVLRDCGLLGKFPNGIFHLPNLRVLILHYNPYLSGQLPEFRQGSHLETLRLASTGFSGKLPESIGNLNFMNMLDVYKCNFSGSLPASLDNLTRLTYLDLGFNKFSGDIPHLGGLSRLRSLSLCTNGFNAGTLPWHGKLAEVTKLYLCDINLVGSIPSSLSNLTHLTHLLLRRNHFTGEIPPQLTNLTQLTVLDLSKNQLQGPIPSSLSKLKSIDDFNACCNNFSGTFDFDILLNLKSLNYLQLHGNKLTVLMENTRNSTVPKFKILGLGSCNLKKFPDFLRFQDKLEVLILSDNKFQGQIPAWMLNVSKETLETLFLDRNFLTGFDQSPAILPWINLALLQLEINSLKAPLPIPPPSTIFYDISDNKLTGEIPLMICQISSLGVLDLSNNNFTGTIPPCLTNFSSSLFVLNLKGNNFQGPIPQAYSRGNILKMIDFSENQLQGKVPRSLARCTMLEIIDLSDNLIEDEFPLWLGGIPKLRVLNLRSNKFYGTLGTPRTNSEFPNLHIIDLSHNGFTGSLPARFFLNWNRMQASDFRRPMYLQAPLLFGARSQFWNVNYAYSVTITTKGVKRKYVKILNIFTAIDLSGNKFKGEIPESVGNIEGLQLLNLSNNNLSGGIPSSLGNLRNLEAMDLSQNKLSGEIPQQLTQLTFLAFLNVSHNNLTGNIPTGPQFSTFQNNSYDGNSGLCGEPLSRKCGSSGHRPQPSPPVSDSEFPSTTIDWIVRALGYGSGTIVGVVVGQILTTRYHGWFVETFGRKKQKRRKVKRSS